MNFRKVAEKNSVLANLLRLKQKLLKFVPVERHLSLYWQEC